MSSTRSRSGALFSSSLLIRCPSKAYEAIRGVDGGHITIEVPDTVIGETGTPQATHSASLPVCYVALRLIRDGGAVRRIGLLLSGEVVVDIHGCVISEEMLRLASPMSARNSLWRRVDTWDGLRTLVDQVCAPLSVVEGEALTPTHVTGS